MTAPPREPDAWMYTKEGQEPCFNGHGKRFATFNKGWTEVPLYAAPAPTAAQPAEPPAQAATDDLDRTVAILQARDLSIAEFHAMQIPVAATIITLRATIDQQARELADARAALCAARSYINESDGAEFASDLLAMIDAAKGAK